MNKLSQRQQEVLDLMNAGWELGLDIAFHGQPWLQKGGLGRGGDSKRISHATLFALHKRGLIKIAKREFPLETYRLK